MDLLYTNISVNDFARIVTHLESSNTPYHVENSHKAIYVPQEYVATTRVALAEQGLPSSANTGYELIDNLQALGMSGSREKIQIIRALEGEIARTIRSIQSVIDARVHIVIPNRNLFNDQSLHPSASVFIRIQPNSALRETKINGIRHLIASAVPGMDLGRVTIVDSSGVLLTPTIGSGEATALSDREADERKKKFEINLEKSLTYLLEKITGEGNVFVKVEANIDDDKLQTEEEIFDPDSQIIISSDSSTESEDYNNALRRRGITIGDNLNADVQQQSKEDSTPIRMTNREIRNYSLSRKTIRRVRSKDRINRISAAILLNETQESRDSNASARLLNTEYSLEKIDALVKAAIGYDPARGDFVNVTTIPFKHNSFSNPVAYENNEQSIEANNTRWETIMFIGAVGVSVICMIFVAWYFSRKKSNRFIVANNTGNSQRVPSEATSRPQLSDSQPGLMSRSSDILAFDVASECKSDDADSHSNEDLIRLIEERPLQVIGAIRSWLGATS
jgi:flagellar M-ring protein FliF